MVTSHDVARLAGVSQPTVSRALRGLPGVAPETVERVVAAARSLGYVPSEKGRALSTRKTRRIGVVAGELTNPFYPELLEPMRVELERHGYRMILILDSTPTDSDLERLVDGSFDGVILTTSLSDSSVPALLRRHRVPYVLANRLVDGDDGDSCAFDNASGAASVADYFVSEGHRRIAQIAGPSSVTTGRDRATAFRDSLSRHGIPLPKELDRSGDFSFESGYRLARELMALSDPPTAIFCGNDVIALGAYDAISEIRTPSSRPSIVGFDNISITSWNTFRISTVGCDLARLARESVRLVLQRIMDPSRPAERIVLPTRLLIRDSSRRARRTGRRRST